MRGLPGSGKPLAQSGQHLRACTINRSEGNPALLFSCLPSFFACECVHSVAVRLCFSFLTSELIFFALPTWGYQPYWLLESFLPISWMGSLTSPIVCASINLFLWVARWCLSDDNQARHPSISIAEYHKEWLHWLLFPVVLEFNLDIWAEQPLDFGQFTSCQAWGPSWGMSLK